MSAQVISIASYRAKRRCKCARCETPIDIRSRTWWDRAGGRFWCSIECWLSDAGLS